MRGAGVVCSYFMSLLIPILMIEMIKISLLWPDWMGSTPRLGWDRKRIFSCLGSLKSKHSKKLFPLESQDWSCLT